MRATHLAADHLPPASLPHARTLRDDLARLLDRERSAAADFLLALADFDERRCWEALGHASLFAFLTRELGLSKGGAFFRLTAARLVARFPEVLEPLRDGRLCITSVVELARVLTAGNAAEVLPRFFGCSSREAREVAATLAPREAPPLRAVVTSQLGRSPAVANPTVAPAVDAAAPEASALAAVGPAATLAFPPLPAPIAVVQSTEPRPPRPARERDEVEPLDADLRRLHVTVTGTFLSKLAAARDGLSHALPSATTGQVLEAALDLLLERQARAKALVRRPRKATAAAVAPPGRTTTSPSNPTSPSKRRHR